MISGQQSESSIIQSSCVQSISLDLDTDVASEEDALDVIEYEEAVHVEELTNDEELCDEGDENAKIGDEISEEGENEQVEPEAEVSEQDEQNESSDWNRDGWNRDESTEHYNTWSNEASEETSWDDTSWGNSWEESWSGSYDTKNESSTYHHDSNWGAQRETSQPEEKHVWDQDWTGLSDLIWRDDNNGWAWDKRTESKVKVGRVEENFK